jgi:hypothetical protein
MSYNFDLGIWSRKISTRSDSAQLWFDRGLNWTYAYNHEEAVACFQSALEEDAECAMGHRLCLRTILQSTVDQMHRGGNRRCSAGLVRSAVPPYSIFIEQICVRSTPGDVQLVAWLGDRPTINAGHQSLSAVTDSPNRFGAQKIHQSDLDW